MHYTDRTSAETGDRVGRHSVAVFLNTANPSVSCALNTAGVVGAFSASYGNGNFEAQKNVFAGYNEQGCPSQ